jgi:phytoene synthase
MPPVSADRLPAAKADDLAVCRAILAKGSRTFFLASHLLPEPVRSPASALYAFCRVADDEVDLRGGRLAALGRLRERLDLAYAGRPLARPLDRALADVVHRFAMPRALPEALLEGLAWDAEGRQYQDLSGLHAYAARVAGSVGAMMARLMGVADPAVATAACDLGQAMQLSNIARDVGEDARAGRLYLPRAWLGEAGIDADAWLRAPAASEAIAAVVGRLLAVADGLYRRADAGIARLPLACRPGIAAARLLYAEIGHEVGRLGPAAFDRRAVVPPARKAALVARALARTLPARPPLATTVIAEAAFLVDALAAQPLPVPPGLPWWQIDARMGRVLELFACLEQRERPGCSVAYAGLPPQDR